MQGGYSTFVATTPAKKEQLFRFRYQIFVEEQQKYARLADHAHKRLADELDDDADHICVEKDGALVAALRMIRGADRVPDTWRATYQSHRFSGYRPEQIAFTGRLFVLPEYRGTPALLNAVAFNYSLARAQGVLVSLINCNPHLVRLYERLGYRRYLPSYEDPNVGYQVPLAILLDDHEYLKKVRSPFAALSGREPVSEGRTEWFEATFPDYLSVVSPLAMGAEQFFEYLSRKVNTSDVPLLRGLDEDETQSLLGSTTHLRVEPERRLVRQGDAGLGLFVILEGVAEVWRAGGQAQCLLATLGRGDVVGEMSVVTSRVRSADVVAKTALEVMSLDQAFLRKLITGNPRLASKILMNLCQILAERLEVASAQAA